MAEKLSKTIKPSMVIDHYRVMEEVGAGGLGRVFRAIDEYTGKTVAVKVLHEKFANDPKFLGIFHRELLIMSRLHHKHILSYIDSHFQPPNCYIITEFIEGWSGHAFFKKVRKLPPLVALSIVIDMLQGIDHLHLHDTIHSDLSAANYMLDREGRVYVMDFGLSCQMQIEDYKNYLIGTPGYYSPEHITDSPLVPQTDIYCAGLILYELVTGAKAVPPLSDRAKIVEYMKRIDFKKIDFRDRKLTSMMRKLLKRALQYNASRRIESADKMMFECYEILRRYNIRYARHAIAKFLVDKKMARGPFTGFEQDIYIS
ncbi:MAG: serine/threonine-protein kinase [Bdellovibrionota bacterium]